MKGTDPHGPGLWARNRSWQRRTVDNWQPRIRKSDAFSDPDSATSLFRERGIALSLRSFFGRRHLVSLAKLAAGKLFRRIVAVTLVQIPIDEDLLASAGVDPAHAGEEFRRLTAAKLFELRRLSLRQAARLADMPLADFMSELGQLKISFVNLTADEMRHDIATA